MTEATMSRGGVSLEYGVSPSLRRMWWVLLILGICWIWISLILLRFNVSSVRAVGIIAGVVFITWGIEEFGIMAALLSVRDTAGGRSSWLWLHGVLGLILVAGGIVALANPVNTFVSIAALIGWILAFRGIFDIVLALSNRDTELWWLRLVLGIVTLLLAVVISGSFVQKAVFLVLFVAAGAMVRGITNIAWAFQLRSMK